MLCFLAIWVLWVAVDRPILLYWGLTTVMVAAFTAGRAFTFFILFELSLVPIGVLILSVGGRPERVEAVVYMAGYTLVGGGLHVLGLVILSSFVGGTSLLSQESGTASAVVWAVLAVALLVKVPCYGVHLWLPKAHVEAPTGGSMVLAGVMLKLGIFGLGVYSRWCLLPPAMCHFIIIISLVGGVWSCFAMFFQADMKGLAAYRSVVHMAVALCAMSLQTPGGVKAGLLVAVGHGFSRSAVFLLVGGLRRLRGSRNPMLVGGVRQWGSRLFLLSFCVFFCANGTPPFFSFWGELCRFIYVASGVGLGARIILLFSGVLCPAAYFTLYFRRISGFSGGATLSLLPPIKLQLQLFAHIAFLIFFFILPSVWGGV